SGYAIADYLSAAWNAFAIAIVLYHRDAQGDGRGQVIDLALYEPLLRASEGAASVYDRFGIVRERAGNRHPAAVPSGLYETAAGAGTPLFAAPDPLFRRLTAAMGRPELAEDPRFAKASARRKNAELIEAEVAGWFAKQHRKQVLDLLLASGVPAAGVNSIAD